MNLSIVQGDITQFHADAIVNAANTSLLGGAGVDGAIHRVAGPGLMAECKTLNGCPTGEARITGGYDLPCRYVIHTPGPIWRGGGHGEAAQLASCYRSCLTLALENGCRTVAFPSISTGVYHYPLMQAAHVALKAITDFLRLHPQLSVTMVCHSSQALHAYQVVWNMLYRTLQILISSYALVPMPIFSACSRQLIQSVSGWMRWKWSWSWASPPSAAEPRITG